MQWFTALFLTVFSVMPTCSFGQESVQDWSKKVLELQEKEGQSFEQDLQLVKGFLYLQRRAEALTLLNRLMKIPTKAGAKKDSRLLELYETASDQFFLQDTAELNADVVQLIREESWTEAKEKVDAGLQKEGKHRLLTMRAIQLGLVLGQVELVSENAKIAETFFPDFTPWKIYNAWINAQKNDTKESYRVISSLWTSDQKLFEKTEVAMLLYLQSLEATKHAADWVQLSKIILKHPEWVGVRLWRLKNKNFAAADRKKEVAQMTELFHDLKKLKELREKEAKDSSYYYSGLISVEKTKVQFEEFLQPSTPQ